MADIAVVVLAAGHGSRMKSQKNKVLHEVAGTPMVELVVEIAVAVSERPPVVVVSPYDSEIRTLLGDRVVFVDQPQRLGTGHATMVAAPLLKGLTSQVIVTYADMPLLRAGSMNRLAEKQRMSGAAIALLVVQGDNDSTFGRVMVSPDGRVTEIIEVAEARRRTNAEEILRVREHNAGVYCFDAEWLWENLDRLPLRQARDNEEYYLTDMVTLAVEQDLPVEAVTVEDADECLGAGTRYELAVVEAAMRRRINRMWMDSGVTILDPESTYIDRTVTIGCDTVLWPNTYLKGITQIGDDCIIGPGSIIRNATIGDGCLIEQSVVENVVLEDWAIVAPFSHLSG